MAKSATEKQSPERVVEGHFNFAEGSYLESTGRPLYALLFLLPLLGVYEIGTFLVDQIAQTQARVAAFTWLIELAEWLGMDRSLAWAFPGFVVVIILLCWQLSSEYPWRLRPRWLGWMAVECVVLSLPLLALNAALGRSLEGVAQVCEMAEPSTYLAQIVTSIGAGIYEELVFRLILMGLILMLMEDLLKVKTAAATAIAVVVSSVLFAAHHYWGFQSGHLVPLPGETLSLTSFMFRTMAGVYFAIIFHYRGYGIIAGTHAAYNVVLYSLLH
jgi:CAAX prenyl protease-like protein